jgi:hypothetical protein
VDRRYNLNFDALIAYCFEAEWVFDLINSTALVVHRQVSQGELTCVAGVDPGYFVFRSLYPFWVPKVKRVQAAEFVARVNYPLTFGNLFLNLRNGEIGFATALPVEEGHLCPALIDPVVQLNLTSADQWFPGVMAVASTDIAPQRAIELCIACSITEVIAHASDLLEGDDDEEDDDE